MAAAGSRAVRRTTSLNRSLPYMVSAGSLVLVVALPVLCLWLGPAPLTPAALVAAACRVFGLRVRYEPVSDAAAELDSRKNHASPAARPAPRAVAYSQRDYDSQFLNSLVETPEGGEKP